MLARTAIRHDVDIVVGSTRYAGAGSGEGLNGAARAATSSWATRLAKTLFPRRLATVSDPMSGLFAFRRTSVNLDQVNPVGFKILLEPLVRHRTARVRGGQLRDGRPARRTFQGVPARRRDLPAPLGTAAPPAVGAPDAGASRDGPRPAAGVRPDGGFRSDRAVRASGSTRPRCGTSTSPSNSTTCSVRRSPPRSPTTWNFLLVDTLISPTEQAGLPDRSGPAGSSFSTTCCCCCGCPCCR